MYERFTDRARKVMQLAAMEAFRFNHEHVGTEHVLLGLVKEESGVAANLLMALGIDLHRIRREVEKVVRPGPEVEYVGGRLPQTPGTQRLLEGAIQEARNLNHSFVGTEHLLLGILREQEDVAAQVLTNSGLDVRDVREAVLGVLGHGTPMVVGGPPDVPAPLVVADPDTPRAPRAPQPTAEHLQLVRDRVRALAEQKEAAVLAQDFVLAARCRDEADALARLLAWYEWFSARQ